MNFTKTKLKSFEDRVFTAEFTGFELLAIYAGLKTLRVSEGNTALEKELGLRLELDIDRLESPVKAIELHIKRNHGVE